MLAHSHEALLSFGRRFFFVLLLIVGFSLASSVGSPTGLALAPSAHANPLEDIPSEDRAIPEPPNFGATIERARRGQVYQILQHRGGGGSEATHFTMVVGSELGGANACAYPGNRTAGLPAEQNATTSQGNAFPINNVYKSRIIDDASTPCFNVDGPGRNGLVCIGPGCTATCDCPSGNCATFTLNDVTAPGVFPITTATVGVPAAALVDPYNETLNANCNAFARATYSFGATAPNFIPTSSRSVCTVPPSDGFTLDNRTSEFTGGTAGQTLIIAYRVGPSSEFAVSHSAFRVDRDNINSPMCNNLAIDEVIGAVSGNATLSPPLLAQIESFTATSLRDEILLEWTTSTEINNLGFNLYRSATNVAPETPLNAELIPSQAPGGGQGFSYEWLDATVVAGETYHYWIEDVDVDGTRTLHDPITVTHQPPTAVTLATLNTAHPGSALPWLLLAGSVGAGLVALHRRQRRTA